ncbi:MAG: hypothetical protein FWG72_06485 [Oscillospiraceae bacterium]|nr:hypothetical protein [Oscillospiraceae bacterium]
MSPMAKIIRTITFIIAGLESVGVIFLAGLIGSEESGGLGFAVFLVGMVVVAFSVIFPDEKHWRTGACRNCGKI